MLLCSMCKKITFFCCSAVNPKYCWYLDVQVNICTPILFVRQMMTSFYLTKYADSTQHTDHMCAPHGSVSYVTQDDRQIASLSLIISRELQRYIVLVRLEKHRLKLSVFVANLL